MKAGLGICYAVAQIQHNPKSAQGKQILPEIDGVFGTTTMGRRFGSFIWLRSALKWPCVGAFAGGFYL